MAFRKASPRLLMSVRLLNFEPPPRHAGCSFIWSPSGPCRNSVSPTVRSRLLCTRSNNKNPLGNNDAVGASSPCCWKCGSPINNVTNNNRQGSASNGSAIDPSCANSATDPLSGYFCAVTSCGVLQPPSTSDYYSIFGMPQLYDIDTQLLTKLYKQLQQKLHPDLGWTFTQEEREFSKQHSSLINKAYETLLKPVPRALYLLQLNSSSLEEKDIHLDPEFLMNLMELNEEVAEEDNPDKLSVMFEANKKKIETLIQETSTAFQIKDIKRAKELIARIKYFASIEDKIKSKTYLY